MKITIFTTLFLCLFIGNIYGVEKNTTCFTIYPNVLVRSNPNQKSYILRKIENASMIEVVAESTVTSKIKIRNVLYEGNWVKISDGWIFSKLIKCVPKITFAFTGIYHGDELPFHPKAIQDWIAIYLNGNIFSRELIDIVVKRVHDPIVDENKNIKTGYEIVAKDNPRILIRGIPFKKESFQNSLRKTSFDIKLNKKYEFSYGNDKYILKASGVDNESFGIRDYKLILQKNEEKMIISSDNKRFELIYLAFVGDLDGDGELDFIFNVSDHPNVSEFELYISSQKDNDFFVVPVSRNSSTGC